MFQLGLTGIGDGEAVSCLNVVHVGHQVKGRFRRIGARVVQKYGQAKGSVLLICVSDEQPACRDETERQTETKVIFCVKQADPYSITAFGHIQNVSRMKSEVRIGPNAESNTAGYLI